jgi:hypothetical protein
MSEATPPAGELGLHIEQVDGRREEWVWRRSEDGGEPPGRRGGPAVVFDLDGVLSDASGRQHFLDQERRDWVGFFEACGDDPVVEEVGRLLELLDPSLAVVLLTGRPQRVRPQTLAWLQRYQVRWDLLVMRAHGDFGPVDVFKQAVVEDLRGYGFDIRLAFEDDPTNHAMYVAAGIPCVYIHSGYYE